MAFLPGFAVLLSPCLDFLSAFFVVLSACFVFLSSFLAVLSALPFATSLVVLSALAAAFSAFLSALPFAPSFLVVLSALPAAFSTFLSALLFAPRFVVVLSALAAAAEPLSRQLRRQLRLSVDDFARLFLVTARTVYNWENRDAKPSRLHERFMRVFLDAVRRSPDVRTEIYVLMDECAPLAPFALILQKASPPPVDAAPTAPQPTAAPRRP
ncbi:helix-turn-helix domain-containing protein [Nannocystis exedens]|uniref:helix-turn-helix domain-containing protein n=1 Tax=Nannocystis exedens TaxID=54 RepID=UPI000BBA0453|nr:hypothetical protein [Nannocystis exedens]